MICLKTRSPGAVNAEALNRNQKRFYLISDNPHPRQRWRGNPPRKRILMSAELLADLTEITKKWGPFYEY